MIVAKIKACAVKGTPPLVYATQPTLCRWADSVDSDIMDKGGSFPSKASSQEQDLRVATIDIHLVFHHILSGKYLWLRLGVFFLQSELKCGTIDEQFLLRLLRIKPQGSFFYFFRGLKNSNMEVP